MRIPRIYTAQSLSADSIVNLEVAPSHHLSRVIRLQCGDPIRLFNGNGEEYAGKIAVCAKQNLTVNIETLSRTEPLPSLRINLYLGISRGERMDYAMQKAVELGVSSIRPLFTKRCMVKLEGKRQRQRMEHWQNILINACEQSGRCRIPMLDKPTSLTEAMKTVPEGTSLVLHHRSEHTLRDLDARQGEITILVGPEGGLSDEEREFAVQEGFITVRLGPRILRTETAPLAAIAAMQVLWGDFR